MISANIAHGVRDYPTLLKQIKKRPQMFIGGSERSVTLLDTFISGIQYGEYIHSINSDDLLGGFSWGNFEVWISKQYNEPNLSLNSFGLALSLSGCEIEGFDLWYKWYELFCKQ